MTQGDAARRTDRVMEYLTHHVLFPAADGLTNVAVADYDDIAARMEAGTANRTVAATRMNATSSRAHTIVGITFVQRAKNAAGQTTDKTAVINLVDLAGRFLHYLCWDSDIK